MTDPVGLPEVLQFRGGIDRRMTERCERAFGRFAWSCFNLGLGAFDTGRGLGLLFGDGLNPDFQPAVGALRMIPVVMDPAEMPYDADDAGVEFPDGTLHVLMSPLVNGVTFGWDLEAVATQTITHRACGYPKRHQRFLFCYYGADPGSTCSVVLTKEVAGTVLSTRLVDTDDDGVTGIVALPIFDGFDDDTIDLVVTWSGAAPRNQFIMAHPFMVGNYVAVPDTLPDGYVARVGTEQFTQSVSLGRDNFQQGRSRSQTYESIGNQFLDGNTEDLVWLTVADVAGWHRIGWEVEATNQDIQTVIQSYSADVFVDLPDPLPDFYVDVPPPADEIIITNGLREITFHAEISSGSGTLGQSFQFIITRSDSGTPVLDITLTDAQLTAGYDGTTGAVLPSTFEWITLTFQIVPVAHHYLGSPIQVSYLLSPRCDIALPYVTAGPGDRIAPGGYVESALVDPDNPRPPKYLDEGVTSYSPSADDGAIGFMIDPTPDDPDVTGDGWYTVVQSAAMLAGVTEYEFGYSGACDVIRQTERGRRGRRFWCVPGTGSAAVLTRVHPTFSEIMSADDAGTLLDLTQWEVWDFGMTVFPEAGEYVVSVFLGADEFTNEQLRRGLVWEYSLADDEEVVRPIGSHTFEAWEIAATRTFQGVVTEPPTGDAGNCWIVGADATEELAGHKDDVLTWDSVLEVWVFTAPKQDMYLEGAPGVWMIYRNGGWIDSVARLFRQKFTVTEATTIYHSFGAFTTERANILNTGYVFAYWQPAEDAE